MSGKYKVNVELEYCVELNKLVEDCNFRVCVEGEYVCALKGDGFFDAGCDGEKCILMKLLWMAYNGYRNKGEIGDCVVMIKEGEGRGDE